MFLIFNSKWATKIGTGLGNQSSRPALSKENPQTHFAPH
jgi:hypothetical protein